MSIDRMQVAETFKQALSKLPADQSQMSREVEFANPVVDIRDGVEIRRNPFEKSGTHADRVAQYMSPEMQITIEVGRIDRAAKEFTRAGYTLPKVITDAIANFKRLGKTPAEPKMPDFALDPAKFDREFSKYADALDSFDRESRATKKILGEAHGHVLRAARNGFDEVLAQLRPEFQESAEVYERTRMYLTGATSLADAAQRDLTGESVRMWHERAAAGDRLSRIVDLVKRFGESFAPLGWTSEMIVLACAPVRGSHVVPIVGQTKTMTDFPEKLRRYEAIVMNGYRLDLAGSSEELRKRFGALSGSTVDEDSDSDPTVEVEIT